VGARRRVPCVGYLGRGVRVRGLNPPPHLVTGADHHERLRVGLSDDLAQRRDLPAVGRYEQHHSFLARETALPTQDRHPPLQPIHDRIPNCFRLRDDDQCRVSGVQPHLHSVDHSRHHSRRDQRVERRRQPEQARGEREGGNIHDQQRLRPERMPNTITFRQPAVASAVRESNA
jgi:hypothetical protein